MGNPIFTSVNMSHLECCTTQTNSTIFLLWEDINAFNTLPVPVGCSLLKHTWNTMQRTATEWHRPPEVVLQESAGARSLKLLPTAEDTKYRSQGGSYQHASYFTSSSLDAENDRLCGSSYFTDKVESQTIPSCWKIHSPCVIHRLFCRTVSLEDESLLYIDIVFTYMILKSILGNNLVNCRFKSVGIAFGLEI